MRIIVVSITGKKIDLDVKASDTIAHVKEQIQHKKGIPQCWQRLLYGIKELDDSRTLSECNVEEGATFDLTLRTQTKVHIKLYKISYAKTVQYTNTDTNTCKST